MTFQQIDHRDRAVAVKAAVKTFIARLRRLWIESVLNFGAWWYRNMPRITQSFMTEGGETKSGHVYQVEYQIVLRIPRWLYVKMQARVGKKAATLRKRVEAAENRQFKRDMAAKRKQLWANINNSEYEGSKTQ